MKKTLTKEAIGEFEIKANFKTNPKQINRQSETIKDALEMLKEVEVYNQIHRAAINLPSVQTPSQIKKVLWTGQGYGRCSSSWSKSKKKKILFSLNLPDFSKTEKVTGAEIGSATHELMQRINLIIKPTLETLTEALEQVQSKPSC